MRISRQGTMQYKSASDIAGHLAKFDFEFKQAMPLDKMTALSFTQKSGKYAVSVIQKEEEPNIVYLTFRQFVSDEVSCIREEERVMLHLEDFSAKFNYMIKDVDDEILSLNQHDVCVCDSYYERQEDKVTGKRSTLFKSSSEVLRDYAALSDKIDTMIKCQADMIQFIKDNNVI